MASFENGAAYTATNSNGEFTISAGDASWTMKLDGLGLSGPDITDVRSDLGGISYDFAFTGASKNSPFSNLGPGSRAKSGATFTCGNPGFDTAGFSSAFFSGFPQGGQPQTNSYWRSFGVEKGGGSSSTPQMFYCFTSQNVNACSQGKPASGIREERQRRGCTTDPLERDGEDSTVDTDDELGEMHGEKNLIRNTTEAEEHFDLPTYAEVTGQETSPGKTTQKKKKGFFRRKIFGR